jgi:ABC-type nitrate/sulfonate/bicarbonate transport system substrate-binding protein
MKNNRAFPASAMAALGCLAILLTPAAAQETKLRINVFPSPQNLPLYAAQDEGFFTKRGMAVEFQVTPNSQAQREGLVQHRFEIAQSGVDNALSLIDVDKADVAIVSGGSSGLNELIVRPEIASYADLRGKTMVVDAPNTAFALILYRMLELNGIKRQDYQIYPAGACSYRLDAMRSDNNRVAAMMNPPCSMVAKAAGFKSFGLGTDVIGPYLADGHWVLRSWARENANTLVKYLQSVIEGYRWAANPANHAAAVAIAAKTLKTSEDFAAQSVALELDSNAGLAKDVNFDMEGFKNTLKLRAEFEGGAPNADPHKYIDLSYYEQALKGM